MLRVSLLFLRCGPGLRSRRNRLIMPSYIVTLPAEWRFYRSQSSIFHLRYVFVRSHSYTPVDKLNLYQSRMRLILSHTVLLCSHSIMRFFRSNLMQLC
jgi:hypothetical protein